MRGQILQRVRARAYRAHWRIREHRVQNGLMSTIDGMQRSQFWPVERLVAVRTEKLQRLVARAHARIPGYRRLMEQAAVVRRYGLLPDEMIYIATRPAAPAQ